MMRRIIFDSNKRIKFFLIGLLAIFILFGIIYSNSSFIYNKFLNSNQIYENNENKHIPLNNGSGNFSLTSNSNIDMLEHANITSTKNNTSDVNIKMPSKGWNATNIQLNFTNIKLSEETVVLASENESSDFWILDSSRYQRLAMQIEVSEEVKLFSVQILGFSLGRDLQDGEVSVKLTDWDGGNNNPINLSSPYGETVLNISNIARWHTQKFSDPIDLKPGNYALVLDGRGTIKDDIDIYWFINQSNPNPLYMSYYYNKGFIIPNWGWDSIEGDIFCHKLTWRANRLYYPSEIEMKAIIDEIPYNISDGSEEGKGSVSISNLNFTIFGSYLDIEVSNNQSIDLIFNISYSISLSHIKSVISRVRIGESGINYWEILPEIKRFSNYYSVMFEIPSSWYNISVYKDGIESLSDPDITFENNILHVSNNSISYNSAWRITAQNDQLSFSVNISKEIYNPADTFELQVSSSFINGNLRFLLYDCNNHEKANEIRSISDNTELFSYVIRSDDDEGDWNALVYWNNQTDASIEFASFTVDIPFVITPLSVFLISLLSVGSVSIAYGSYKILKRRKRIQEKRKRKIIEKCLDIVNLNHIIVTDKKSSLTLFDQEYVEKGLEPNLISGFIQAIRSFGIELTNSEDVSQIIKLEYRNLKIIMDEYSKFRIILMMRESPSDEFLEDVKELSYELKEKFEPYLKDFKGNIKPFRYIDRLIVKHLNGELLYSLKLNLKKNIKTTPAERVIILKISKLLKNKNTNKILFREIVQEKSCDPDEIITIKSLIEKNILKPMLDFK